MIGDIHGRLSVYEKRRQYDKLPRLIKDKDQAEVDLRLRHCLIIFIISRDIGIEALLSVWPILMKL